MRDRKSRRNFLSMQGDAAVMLCLARPPDTARESIRG
jgi:hypothetical protein